MRVLLAALLLCAFGSLHAATFRGTVTHVTDGDSLWVRRATGGPPVQLRLLDIDAPEACQAHGPEATRALRQRLLRQPVRVHAEGKDDYQRLLVRVEHRKEDVGRWMVRNGHAWSATFRNRPGPHAQLEVRARQARKGLWARAGAESPRNFRQRHGPCPRPG